MVSHRIPRNDSGFTLIELLAVVVIIGILASISIPVFYGQRAKAAGAATQSDVRSVGERIAEYYVSHGPADPVPAVVISGGAMMTVAGEDVAVASDGVQLVSTSGTGAMDWCIAVTNAQHSAPAVWSFTALGGLEGPHASDPC